MYLLPRHQPPSPAHVTALIHAHPLAAIVVGGQSGLDANHVPLLYNEAGGVLQGHVSTGNELASIAADTETLVLFQGPQSYISPSWCPSKQTSPEIVPTWSYVVVHVHGRLRVIRDDTWLIAHLDAMTNRHEAAVGGAWRVSDAPKPYLQRVRSGIVGIEVRIERITGKWKTTVIRPEENAASVSAALNALGTDDAQAMAALIRERAAFASQGKQ